MAKRLALGITIIVMIKEEARRFAPCPLSPVNVRQRLRYWLSAIVANDSVGCGDARGSGMVVPAH